MLHIRSVRPLGISENKDCTVHALANSVGMPYDRAHGIFKSAGRKDNQPAKSAVWVSVFSKYGEIVFVKGRAIESPTLAQFVRDHPTGNYAVGVIGHMIAVVDGVVIDNRGDTSNRWRVREYVRVR